MKVLSPSSALSKSDRLKGEQITVKGRLINQGKNFFTDRRLVLTDPANRSDVLPVKPWVLIETPPLPGPSGSPPQALSDYLGKTVILKGSVREDHLRGFGKVKYLEVQSARLAE